MNYELNILPLQFEIEKEPKLKNKHRYENETGNTDDFDDRSPRFGHGTGQVGTENGES
jgi:hypothetical protein